MEIIENAFWGSPPWFDSAKKLLWLSRSFALPMTRPRHIMGRASLPASRIAKERCFFS
jgi:hypothetical protein